MGTQAREGTQARVTARTCACHRCTDARANIHCEHSEKAHWWESENNDESRKMRERAWGLRGKEEPGRGFTAREARVG